jgi:hypothetical protein
MYLYIGDGGLAGARSYLHYEEASNENGWRIGSCKV